MAGKTIRFFRAVNPDGKAPSKPIDWESWLNTIDEMDDDAVRLKAPKGIEFLGVSWYGGQEDAADLPDLLLVCAVRRGAGMPLLEEKRKFRRIRARAGEGVAEASHVALFPGNVVAVLRDGYSPSHVRVADYINGILKPDPPLVLEPMLRRNVRRKLSEVDSVRLAHFKFNTDQVRRLAQRVPRLHRMLGRMTEDYGRLTATIDLRVPGRDGFEDESTKLLEDVKALVRTDDIDESAYEEAELTFISTETDKVDFIDFVKERIAVRLDVDTLGEGDEEQVFSPSAARAIQAAYDLVRSDLEEALEG